MRDISALMLCAVCFVFMSCDKTEEFENAHSAVKGLGIGWNIGNTLESNNQGVDSLIEKTTDCSVKAYETAWGQPQVTRKLIHKFKEEGFTSIRVPVTWWPHMNSENIVDEAWMSRVEEVVNYVLDEDMYCILNVHHDAGDASTCWLRADAQNFDSINGKFVKLWEQIAKRFNRYGEKLVFEGYGEVLDQYGTWVYPKDPAALGVMTRLSQSFVNTVRATGGNNAMRNLIICTYGASNGFTGIEAFNAEGVLSSFQMPDDIAKDHLLASVHAYIPWNWDQNHGKFTDKHKKAIADMYDLLDLHLAKRGWPVVIGEYGALFVDEVYASTEPITDADMDEGAKYAEFMVNEAKKRDMAAVYFMGLIDKEDRTKLQWSRPKTVEAIKKAFYESK